MSLSTDDQIEIQQLYARYNTAIDTGDDKGFAACFVENGFFDSGGDPIEGQEGIAAFAAQTHSTMPGLRHNAINIVIDGEGAAARGSAFLIVYLTDGGYKVLTTGRYADELERTDAGWRFTRRVFRQDS
jgi:uncharacterized protein (TIGR02246 family)